MANDYLIAACERLGVAQDKILSYKIYEDTGTIVLVVDNGIAGAPKHTIPLEDLDPAEREAKKIDAKKADLSEEADPGPEEKPAVRPTRRRSTRSKKND